VNEGEHDATFGFLTSDLVVKDDLGNTYLDKGSTDTVQETLRPENVTSFTRQYESIVAPAATDLIISIPKIGQENDIQITIPIDFSSEELKMDFSLTSAREDRMKIVGTIENHGSDDQLVRFQAANITVTDNVGNTYNMQRDEGQSYMVLLQSADTGYYRNSREYNWRYYPAVASEATQLKVTLEELGQESFDKIIPLGTADQDVRYEAVWESVWGDNTRVYLTVFNLGNQDLIVRFDETSVRIKDTQGSVLGLDEPGGKGERVIAPGNSRGYRFIFTGLPTSDNLTLVFPVFCGVEDFEIPVSPAE
jgi:hypothetical protein